MCFSISRLVTLIFSIDVISILFPMSTTSTITLFVEDFFYLTPMLLCLVLPIKGVWLLSKGYIFIDNFIQWILKSTQVYVLLLRTIGGVCSPCNIIVGVHIFKICERGVDDGVMQMQKVTKIEHYPFFCIISFMNKCAIHILFYIFLLRYWNYLNCILITTILWIWSWNETWRHMNTII
jgi:hypothetical protein